MAAFAVTTRTLPTRIEGLAVGIERLEELCPSAVVSEHSRATWPARR